MTKQASVRREQIFEWILFADLFSALTLIFFTIVVGTLPFYFGDAQTCNRHGSQLAAHLKGHQSLDLSSDGSPYELYSAPRNGYRINIRVKDLIFVGGSADRIDLDQLSGNVNRSRVDSARSDLATLCKVGVEYHEKDRIGFSVFVQLVGRTSPDFRVKKEHIRAAVDSLVILGDRKREDILRGGIAGGRIHSEKEIADLCRRDRANLSPWFLRVCQEAESFGNRGVAIARARHNGFGACKLLPIAAITNQQRARGASASGLGQAKGEGSLEQQDANAISFSERTITVQFQPASCL